MRPRDKLIALPVTGRAIFFRKHCDGQSYPCAYSTRISMTRAAKIWSSPLSCCWAAGCRQARYESRMALTASLFYMHSKYH